MISGRELAALRGLPHLAQLLYLAGIRPRMDIETAMAGDNATERISWRILANDLNVEARQGIQSKSITPRMARRASEHLERHGIVHRCTDGECLIFYCLLAETGTKVTSGKMVRVLDRKVVRVLDNQNNGLSPCNRTDSEYQEQQSGQEVGQGSGQAAGQEDLIPYLLKEKEVCEVFNPEGAQRIFENWVDENGKNGFTVTELNNHIVGYFEFCHQRQAKPNREGLKNLLESRLFYREHRRKQREADHAVLTSKQMKQRAIAQREEDIADQIHSNNIRRRNREQ